MARGPIVLACGSRSWQSGGVILDRFLVLPQTTVVIEGDAPGADRLARSAARKLGLHVATVPAQWRQLGRAAGPLRNAAMLALKPDLVIAFWDGESRGTKHMIDSAKSAGVPVEVVRARREGAES